jgi:hypothetical protein
LADIRSTGSTGASRTVAAKFAVAFELDKNSGPNIAKELESYFSEHPTKIKIEADTAYLKKQIQTAINEMKVEIGNINLSNKDTSAASGTVASSKEINETTEAKKAQSAASIASIERERMSVKALQADYASIGAEYQKNAELAKLMGEYNSEAAKLSEQSTTKDLQSLDAKKIKLTDLIETQRQLEYKNNNSDLFKLGNDEQWNNMANSLRTNMMEAIADVTGEGNRFWTGFEQQAAVKSEQSAAMLRKLRFAMGGGSVADFELQGNQSVQSISGKSDNLSNTYSQYQKIGKVTDEITASYNRMYQARVRFEEVPSKETLNDLNAANTALSSKLQLLRSTVNEENKIAAADAKASQSALNNSLQYKQIYREAQAYYGKYGASITKNKDLDSGFKNLFENLNKGNFSGATQARDQLASLQKSAKDLGLEVETLGTKLKGLFSVHLDTMIAMAGVHALTTTIHTMYQNVVDLDKELVNLQVATGGSRSETKQLMSSYSELGKQLGATTAETAQASDDWLRQNKTVAETNTLVKDSLMLSKLGQIDASEATTDLTAVMKANLCPDVQKCA